MIMVLDGKVDHAYHQMHLKNLTKHNVIQEDDDKHFDIQ